MLGHPFTVPWVAAAPSATQWPPTQSFHRPVPSPKHGFSAPRFHSSPELHLAVCSPTDRSVTYPGPGCLIRGGVIVRTACCSQQRRATSSCSSPIERITPNTTAECLYGKLRVIHPKAPWFATRKSTYQLTHAFPQVPPLAQRLVLDVKLAGTERPKWAVQTFARSNRLLAAPGGVPHFRCTRARYENHRRTWRRPGGEFG
ncbi:MAG: hypothetical protein KatS3mg110_3948 [Pirellulaceae bacterium]|nr:MAG: hypothetical protein KatS3mg110_3948 [Pirellulaceae bacterium]